MKPFTLFFRALLAASLATASLATAQQSPPPKAERGPEFGHGPGPAMHPHGVALTEAQQDKLFALHHAAEPAGVAHFAQALGQAIAAEELDHARAQAQFLALLTPEQRAAMQKAGRGPGSRP